MPFLEKKLLTTEKVTTSDNLHKLTEKITTNEEVDKGTENLEDMKEAVLTTRRKDLYKFRVSLKDLQDGLILIMSLKKKIFYT